MAVICTEDGYHYGATDEEAMFPRSDVHLIRILLLRQVFQDFEKRERGWVWVVPQLVGRLPTMQEVLGLSLNYFINQASCTHLQS